MSFLLPIKWLGYFFVLSSLVLINRSLAAKDFSSLPLAMIDLALGAAWIFYVNWKKVDLKEKPRIAGLFILTIGIAGIYAFMRQGIDSLTDYLGILFLLLISLYALYAMKKDSWT